MGEGIYTRIEAAILRVDAKQDIHADRLTRIETLLKGNGTRGLCQRLEELEDETRELKAKATARAARAGAIAGVLGLIGGTVGKILLTAAGILPG